MHCGVGTSRGLETNVILVVCRLVGRKAGWPMGSGGPVPFSSSLLTYLLIHLLIGLLYHSVESVNRKPNRNRGFLKNRNQLGISKTENNRKPSINNRKTDEVCFPKHVFKKS